MTLRMFADDTEAEKSRVIPETVKVDAIEEAAQKYSCATPLLRDFYLAMTPDKIYARLNMHKNKVEYFLAVGVVTMHALLFMELSEGDDSNRTVK